MGEIIEFPKENGDFYEMYCPECGGYNFKIIGFNTEDEECVITKLHCVECEIPTEGYFVWVDDLE